MGDLVVSLCVYYTTVTLWCIRVGVRNTCTHVNSLTFSFLPSPTLVGFRDLDTGFGEMDLLPIHSHTSSLTNQSILSTANREGKNICVCVCACVHVLCVYVCVCVVCVCVCVCLCMVGCLNMDG